jgi:hypothetical protein
VRRVDKLLKDTLHRPDESRHAVTEAT